MYDNFNVMYWKQLLNLTLLMQNWEDNLSDEDDEEYIDYVYVPIQVNKCFSRDV